MEKHTCCTCQKPKAALVCGLCESHVCKYCAQFTADDTFSFLTEVPAELQHNTYCNQCYDASVAPALHEYTETMTAAKDILVFNKNQGKVTRLIKRLEEPLQIKNCEDHNEVIMRMAFFAVKANYNALVDVDVRAEKVRSGSYQKTVFSGTAIPVHVNVDKLMKDRSLWSNPN